MNKPIKTLGLITAPGYPTELGRELEDELPDLLQYYVNERYEWQVEGVEDPLTGGTDRSSEVLESSIYVKYNNEWDFAIALTDLPFFKEKKPVIAEAFEEKNVALISLPGFGATSMLKRVRESILQLVNEMEYGTSDEEREQAEQRNQNKDNSKYNHIKKDNSTSLVGNRLFEFLSPIQRETPEDDEAAIDVRFTVKPRLTGVFRILSGMVRANRPWAMFPAFMKVLIIAFTTGAYALIFPTLWQLSNHYNLWRLFLLSIFSILAMVVWIILGHGLWERKRDRESHYARNLYNMTTFLTLLTTVIMYYLLLFLLFIVVVVILVPIGMMESQLSGDIGYINFFYLAWVATSISIIFGALGSALESEEVVLSSTYGYRQRQRYEKRKDAEQEKQDAQEEKRKAQEEKQN